MSILTGLLLLAVALPPAPAPAPPPPEQRARASLNSYFTAADYPRAAVRSHAQGTVGFRVMVGADGRVSGCTVTSSSGHAVLDETTCRLVRARLRFAPAMRDGRPIASDAGEFSVTWRMAD